jgi:hypothetical protein
MPGWLSATAARDVQCRLPVAADGIVWPSAQAEAYFCVEAFALPADHGDVAGEGVEQLDVAVGVVDLLPVEVADVGHLEQAAGVDLGCLVGQFAGAGPGAAGGSPSPISS